MLRPDEKKPSNEGFFNYSMVLNLTEWQLCHAAIYYDAVGIGQSP